MKEIRLLNFKESIHYNIIKSPFKEILVYSPDQDTTNEFCVTNLCLGLAYRPEHKNNCGLKG